MSYSMGATITMSALAFVMGYCVAALRYKGKVRR